MKFNKIYAEWVKYLKKRGLYGKYILDYSKVNEYVATLGHVKFNANSHTLFNGDDFLITNKSKEDMTFIELKIGISRFVNNHYFPPKYDWNAILEEFGVEFGYYKRPKPRYDKYLYGDDELWSECDIYSSYRFTSPTNVGRYRGREEENIGQWYDIYYRNNRGRRERVNNNFINNVRWRR